MTPIVNAMSVDVEDYFQVSAFDRVSRSDWNGLESRVVPNTHRLLTFFDQHNVRRRFRAGLGGQRFLNWFAKSAS